MNTTFGLHQTDFDINLVLPKYLIFELANADLNDRYDTRR